MSDYESLKKRKNRGNLTEVKQRKRGGSKIQAVMLSEPWYQENFPKYKAALESRTLTLIKDADVLADHLAVKTDRGVPKIPANYRYKGTDGLYRHGDTTVALLLSHFVATSNEKNIASYNSIKALFLK